MQYRLLLTVSNSSYLILVPMERTPHSSDALVQTAHRLRDSLQFLSIRIAEQYCLAQNLVRVHVPYTNGLFATVDIMSRDDRVFVRTW